MKIENMIYIVLKNMRGNEPYFMDRAFNQEAWDYIASNQYELFPTTNWFEINQGRLADVVLRDIVLHETYVANRVVVGSGYLTGFIGQEKVDLRNYRFLELSGDALVMYGKIFCYVVVLR